MLQTALEHRITPREPVDKQSVLDRGALGVRLKTVETVGSFVEGETYDEPLKDLPYYRYCWPPIQ